MTDMVPVAILCGGKGTRLGDLTKDTPKSLVKVAGRPFIFWQLDLLKKWGVRRVILCVGHFGDQIQNTVGCGYNGIVISYSRDRLFGGGTMAAIRDAANAGWLGDEFVTLYGDSYLLGSLPLFVEAARNLKWAAVQATYQKVDYGYTYFTKEAWALISECREIGQIGAYGLRYEMLDRFFQIGDPEGLAEVEAMLAPTPAAPDRDDGCAFTIQFLMDLRQVSEDIKASAIEDMVDELYATRERWGRLFLVGLGGSAANASHAVNDFVKLCGIKAFTATDNVSYFTAAGNDCGWRSPFVEHMKAFGFCKDDCLFVLSVGGGQDTAPATSVSVAYAVQHARSVGAPVLGIVGRDGGYTAKHWTCGVIVPTVSEALVTPIQESMQVIILHLLVSHPRLQTAKPRW